MIRWLRARMRAIGLGVLGLTLMALAFEIAIMDVMHSRRAHDRVGEYHSNRNQIGAGGAIGLLQAKSIGLNQVVGEGVGASALRGGVGHHPDTPLPGEDGNVVLAGHKRRYGGPFAELHKLKEGEEVVVLPRGGAPIAYRVEGVATTTRAGMEKLASQASAKTLTLVTSDGGLVPTRYVVVTARTESALAAASGAAPAIDIGRLDLTDFGRITVWAAALVALVVLARGFRRSAALMPLVLMVPMLALSALQLLLAFESVTPATV